MRPITTEQLLAMLPPSKTISPELTRELVGRGLIEVHGGHNQLFRLTPLGDLAVRVHAAFLSSVYSEGLRIT